MNVKASECDCVNCQQQAQQGSWQQGPGLNQRPTSYGTGVTGGPGDAKPTPAEESYRKAKELACSPNLGAWYPPPIKLTVEQIHAELRRYPTMLMTADSPAARVELVQAMTDLLDQLPNPPKPDVVEECAIAACEQADDMSWNNLTNGTKAQWCRRVRAALRRYRELGCPEIPE